jgi:hypothetical protein
VVRSRQFIACAASALLVMALHAAGAEGEQLPPMSEEHWVASGSATLYPGKEATELTQNAGNQAGSTLYRTPIGSGRLSADFDELMNCGSAGCNGADGLAFDILDAGGLAEPPPVGGGGGELGFYPNHGIAVTLTQNSVPWACYPADHFIGVADSEAPYECPLHYLTTVAGIPELHNAEHHVHLVIDWPRSIQVAIDGAPYLTYELPSTTALPSPAYIGFSAGTGNGAELHFISNLQID